MDLKGAVAVVTGGNGGLGQRICHALAKEGAHVAVMYAQSRDQAEGVARELASRHQINAAAFACDITDGAAVGRLVDDVVKRFGRLAFEEGRRQGRLRRHGGDHVPHRDHDRSDDRDRLRALFPLTYEHQQGREQWLTKA